jgi:hypothetical protein
VAQANYECFAVAGFRHFWNEGFLVEFAANVEPTAQNRKFFIRGITGVLNGHDRTARIELNCISWLEHLLEHLTRVSL